MALSHSLWIHNIQCWTFATFDAVMEKRKIYYYLRGSADRQTFMSIYNIPELTVQAPEHGIDRIEYVRVSTLRHHIMEMRQFGIWDRSRSVQTAANLMQT